MEIEPDDKILESLRESFINVKSYEIIESLKIDFEQGICFDIIEFTLRDNVEIEDVKNFGNMNIINVIRSEGSKHTCLVKYVEPEESIEGFRESDLGIIHTTPTILSEEKITVSVIGEKENLMKFIEMMKKYMGKIDRMSFKRASYQRQDLLSVLTDKQREVLKAAQKSGYYDYPKRISSEKLSEKVNLSKATMLQHLRKAESRIFQEIMTGY